MGHIPFCFYPSLLEQWLNCFNNLYMGKTFKRQIRCSLESVQIEMSRGHWILNTTHISLSIQNYPHSQTPHINPCTHTITHTLNQHTSVHTCTHIHTHNPHILNTAYINPCTHTYTQSPTFSTQHTPVHARACMHAHTHTHTFFFLHLIAELHQGKNHVPSAWNITKTGITKMNYKGNGNKSFFNFKMSHPWCVIKPV